MGTWLLAFWITVILIIAVRYRKNRLRESLLDRNRAGHAAQPVASGHHKVIQVKGVREFELHRMLSGFSQLYPGDNIVRISSRTLGSDDHVLCISDEMDLERFFYLVNYLVYPRELNVRLEVIGWATLRNGDALLPDLGIEKKAMFYIPEEDKEFDNVYMTTEDNIGYKLSFNLSDRRRLTSPPRSYVRPVQDE
jgi:hypothetical protein